MRVSVASPCCLSYVQGAAKEGARKNKNKTSVTVQVYGFHKKEDLSSYGHGWFSPFFGMKSHT